MNEKRKGDETMDGVSLECCHGFQWNRDSSGSGESRSGRCRSSRSENRRENRNAVSVKLKLEMTGKFKLVNKYNINDTSVQADGMDYDDSSWDTVDLPHDWAIYGTYENSNGVRAAQGSLAGGVGWYRKSFTLSDDFKDKTVSIEFDGVQMISQVWVNGHTEDNWKQYLGYNTFTYDISKYLKYDGSENVIAVKVQSSNSSARWYAGAGIYRNVYLISTEKLNVPVNGVQITTPFEKLEAEGGKYEEIKNATKAGVDIKTDVTNDSDTEATGVSVNRPFIIRKAMLFPHRPMTLP